MKNAILQALESRICDRRSVVGIIGLGYVGLPLARGFSAQRFRVLGFDVDRKKIDSLARGESYIGHIDAASKVDGRTASPQAANGDQPLSAGLGSRLGGAWLDC